MFRFALTLGLVFAITTEARADDPVATFALVIGSNPGGPGQTALQFAEDDARRVGAILTELGGYAPGSVELVLRPTPELVRGKLESLAVKVRAEIDAGRQAQLFFYYSGHARATGLDFGSEQLGLDDLRQRLLAVHATLTVVVLDACQSGAFSRIKGAKPAADFSFSSRQQLGASGMAVLASSSGSEYSQESERLKSSYFTHHLLVGMRGAGDTNHDGKVTIDEAYRYAYHQTLLATAETAVGGQHVSLEVDLRGHGDVALSFPRKSTAAIELPAKLEGKVLVEDRRARVVVAETSKARGVSLRMAVSPGNYNVLVRRGDQLARCEVTTTGDNAAIVDLARCRTETIVEATRKGGGFERPIRFELSGTLGGERIDAYVNRLESFGFLQTTPAVGLGLVGMRRVHDKLWVGGGAAYASPGFWERYEENQAMYFGWWSTTAHAIAHAEQPLFDRWAGYARFGAGVGVARTQFVDMMDTKTHETYLGPALTAGAGIHRRDSAFGVLFGYQFDYAPMVENLVGETHASGGHRIVLGASYSR